MNVNFCTLLRPRARNSQLFELPSDPHGGKKLMFVLLLVAGLRGGRGQVRQALYVSVLRRSFPAPEQADPPHPVPQPGIAQVSRALPLSLPAVRVDGLRVAGASTLRRPVSAGLQVGAASSASTAALAGLPTPGRKPELQNRLSGVEVGGGRARGQRRCLQILRSGFSGRECSGGAPARPHRRQTLQVFLLW